MLAYRNPSNEDSDSIFNYTLKLDAYDKYNNRESYCSCKRRRKCKYSSN